MTEHSVAASLDDGAALLERATSYTLGSLLMVTPATLLRRTPCAGWDLRALLLHMNDSLATLYEAAELGQVEVAVPAEAEPTVDRLVGQLKSRACRLLGAWAELELENSVDIADRQLGNKVLAAAGAVEIAVHGWDVSQAVGRPREIPAALAEELLPVIPLIVTSDDRDVRFADPVLVSPIASPGDRLIAYLGRHPA